MKRKIAVSMLVILTIVIALGVIGGCGVQNYKVTFVSKESGESQVESVEKGESVNAPVFSYDGYRLAGFYLQEDFSGSAVSFPYTPNSDVTLYAKWEKIIVYYTVTFHTFGGSAIESQMVAAGEQIEQMPVSSLLGYTFGGWYATSDYSDIGVGFPFKPSKDCALYAKWIPNEPNVYTVAFVTNGGRPTVAPIKTLEGEAVENPTEIKREGYEFLGWYDHAECSGEAVTFPYYPISSITLYAKWEKLPEHYIIRFETNGGHTVPDLDLIEGEKIESSPFTQRDGHAFIGWYDNSECKGEALRFPYTPTASMTLYAKWEERVTEDSAFVISGGVLEGFSQTGKNLKEVIIPSQVGESVISEIAAGAFKNCTALESVRIPASVEKMGFGAFEGCTSLKSVTLPFVGENLDGSGKAFFGHIFGAEDYYSNRQKVPASLKEVIISSGSKIISSAFEDCPSIETVNLPYGITAIESSAFAFCSSLVNVNIPASVTQLGNSAFFNCSSLKEIVLPQGLTEIATSTFEECKKLTAISIPSSVRVLGDYAFSKCISLTEFVMPDSVEEAGSYLFNGCEKLQNVTLSISLSAIEESMFEFCSALVSITVPDSVQTIGRSAFANCTLLSSVTFSQYSELSQIKALAFDRCVSLSGFTVPQKVVNMGEAVFYGCNNLRQLRFLSETPAKLTSGTITDKEQPVAVDTLSGLSKSVSIYVPKGKLQAYAEAAIWVNYRSQLKEGE